MHFVDNPAVTSRGKTFYHVGGGDIDSACRLIGEVWKQQSTDRRRGFPAYLSGSSNGLQCGGDTVAAFVQARALELCSSGEIEGDLETLWLCRPGGRMEPGRFGSLPVSNLRTSQLRPPLW
ncbi:MAG: hypothetical protein EOP84_31090 [Verrucomicrobiaceae bacterium]|nr:MAG: hypothetical protein EOP84_31090 [Verrucomicrobiaceae bacterium]